MDYETITLTREGAVATLTLNRPHVLNAFNRKMHEDMRSVLGSIAADDTVRCLVITGAGRAFCAGQDLSDATVGELRLNLAESLDRNYNPMVRAIRALKIPVVVSVNGVAAGGGANLALSGDIVIAARSAQFIQIFIRIGVFPDVGGTYFLPRLVGRARAAALSMLGEGLPASKAEEWGMIWKCVDDDRLAEETSGLAARLASQPTMAIGLMKRALDKSWANSLDDQLDLERDLQVEALLSHDFSEGVTAFLEKRPARFLGR